MKKNEVIIIGSSGQAKVIIDIFEKSNYQILGLLDIHRAVGEEIMGYKILGSESELPQISLKHPDCTYFIAIGDNWIRSRVRNKVLQLLPNIQFTNAIHPTAILGKSVTLGHGIAIMAGAVVNCQSTLGHFSIINTNASLDHDSQMGDFSSLAPNATTGGNVIIGEFSAISISATVKHGVTVGKHTVIGAASLLLTDAGDNEIRYGIPAKLIRRREEGERYL